MEEEVVENKPTKCLTFGQALEYLKEGFLVSREGWNGKNMFIFMRPGDTIMPDNLPGIRNLPAAFKNFLFAQEQNTKGTPDPIVFLPYLCMKTPGNAIVNGWLSSQTDMLADDWFLVNHTTGFVGPDILTVDWFGTAAPESAQLAAENEE